MDADIKPTSTPVLSKMPSPKSISQLNFVPIVASCIVVMLLLFTLMVIVVILAIKYQRKKKGKIGIQTDKEEKVLVHYSCCMCALFSLYCSCLVVLFTFHFVSGLLYK